MKGLLLDQGLPRSAASLLRASGFEAIHVGELGMAASCDDSIIEHALKEELIVVTLDGDFHAQIALSGASGPSVIRHRAQSLKATEASELIRTVIARATSELASGALISATRKLIRIKRLPIER